MGAAIDRLRRHWPEYLMEAWGLGTFMISAGVVATALEYPGSPLHQALPDPLLRRLLMGLAMGLTAIAIIYSPWGKRSGAHINPAVTFAFWRIGKVHPADAAFYVMAQVLGGTLGVLLVWATLGQAFAAPPVLMVATLPGSGGIAIAFATELAMAFALMSVILAMLPSKRWETRIGYAAGLMVATYITLLAPLSGMSINPARTLASALPAGRLDALWLYLVAPPLGMLLAVEVGRLRRRAFDFHTPKLCPNDDYRCIFTGFNPDAAPAAPVRQAAPRMAAGVADVIVVGASDPPFREPG